MHPLQCVLQAQKWGPLASVSWLLLRTCRALSNLPSTACPSPEKQQEDGVRKDFSSRLATGPTFQHFLRSASAPQEKPDMEDPPPYVTVEELLGRQRKVYLETYGCQMNVNDTEIAWSVLQKSGYLRTRNLQEADVILLVTCSIREKAEQTIWNRLQQLKALKTKRLRSRVPLRIGILGIRSIMRGCDNMCSYCIVPFTRGRERSRPVASILEEVRKLSEQGLKEVTLLGQNVNSFQDSSEVQFNNAVSTNLSRGFSTNYKPKKGGLRFTYLLDQVSRVDPEMRIRFTSPHPKDFPDEVLQLIHERDNICKQIHLPAQSGSSRVLEAMRRGYSREAYVELIHHIRESIPGVSLSSDFIAGFCGETEEDHLQTVSLLREVQYNMGFLFAYSMRQKTRAYHRLKDDVPEEVKLRRLEELITVFREEATKANMASVGSTQLVLVEGNGFIILLTLSSIHCDGVSGVMSACSLEAGNSGQTTPEHSRVINMRLGIVKVSLPPASPICHCLAFRIVGSPLLRKHSKRSATDLCGRNDGNLKVIFPDVEMEDINNSDVRVRAQPGDYVLVKITSTSSQTLKGHVLCRTTLKDSSAYC
ncbi:mitochondrial tRNA methylthiotransferase CDK5RAP1 isoform X3 [Canis lupus familiaris]|uniref:mitochondrial tRNA methylthiotransferase CDK5RAP1 isoform X3 n=1 Tax=Canis lupus familiaris TaxID=9615 RepID=UPI0018F7D20D|nr:mitochondrial tRNA methylthiotransferase CDK5RAP1 isoform X3 [Canis lupus familiaris]